MSDEKEVLKKAKQLAAAGGGVLWRNNCGVLKDEFNRPVRFGLANENKTQNTYFKSADLIGIRKITITPDMVGKQIGQFFAVETKHRMWTYRGHPREAAQRRFLEEVNNLGGFGIFYNGDGEADGAFLVS